MLLVRVARSLRQRFQRAAHGQAPALRVGKADVRPYLGAIQAGLVRTLAGLSLAAIVYSWLTFVLQQFPYTSPWGEQLGGFLFGVLSDLGLGFLHAIPDLFVVLVIFMATRLVTRIAGAFFRSAEGEWMQAEVARATRRLVVGLIWVFALVVAYPYLPGSGTAAFQGISVFVGLMVSLGSSGIVNQLLSGLVAVYARTFSAGDYVRVGEHEGTVTELGALASKVRTVRGEEITIPNSVLVGNATTNFSRLARDAGALVVMRVTVGYDVPWRQVQALLLAAAGRTSFALRDPAPYVLTSGLTEFSVEYKLMIRIARAEERYRALSELHAHVLDAFNEHGVQIMVPAFEGQPEGRVLVPRERWFEPPATGEPAGGGSGRGDSRT